MNKRDEYKVVATGEQLRVASYNFPYNPRFDYRTGNTLAIELTTGETIMTIGKGYIL